MMRDFRKWLGKTGNKFTGTLLERCALTLATRKEVLNVAGRSGVNAGGSTESAPDEESVHVDYIFCEVFVFAMETNLFGPGPPRHCNTRGASKGRDKGRRRGGDRISRHFSNMFIAGEDGFSTICDPTAKLNRNSLRIFDIGDKRLRSYYDVYHKTGDLHDPHRTEDETNGGVSLKSVKPLSTDAEKDNRMKVERSTTTKFEVINSNYTVNELDTEITYLRDYIVTNINGQFTDDLLPPSRVKDNCVAKVIVLRNIIIGANGSDWINVRKEEITNAIEIERHQGGDANSIERIITEELANEFYNLSSYTDSKRFKSFSFSRVKYIAETVERRRGEGTATGEQGGENRNDRRGDGDDLDTFDSDDASFGSFT